MLTLNNRVIILAPFILFKKTCTILQGISTCITPVGGALESDKLIVGGVDSDFTSLSLLDFVIGG